MEESLSKRHSSSYSSVFHITVRQFRKKIDSGITRFSSYCHYTTTTHAIETKSQNKIVMRCGNGRRLVCSKPEWTDKTVGTFVLLPFLAVVSFEQEGYIERKKGVKCPCRQRFITRLVLASGGQLNFTEQTLFFCFCKAREIQNCCVVCTPFIYLAKNTKETTQREHLFSFSPQERNIYRFGGVESRKEKVFSSN